MTVPPDDTDTVPTTRTRLIEAAGEAFARQGYARCSTRHIADEAGLAETLLFRHFGSKAALFDVAVRARFEESVARFAAGWSDTAPADEDPATHAEHFMAGLCAFVADERQAILALMTVNAFGVAEADPAHGGAVRTALGVLRGLIDRHVLVHPAPAGTVRPSAPAVMALVLGVLVLDDSVWSDADRPPVAVTAAEVTAMTLWGVSRRSRRRRQDHRGEGLPPS
jgi:AcrR family transcriptional regulator